VGPFLSPCFSSHAWCSHNRHASRCVISIFDEGTCYATLGWAYLDKATCSFDQAWRPDGAKGDPEACDWEAQIHFPMYRSEVVDHLLVLDGINFGLPSWEEQAEHAFSGKALYQAWVRDATESPSLLGFVRHVVRELAECVKPWAFKRLKNWSSDRFFTMANSKMFLLPQV
jgi:hypothetical protein